MRIRGHVAQNSYGVALATFLMFPNHATATSIILVRRPAHIVLAADSLAISAKPHMVCKISHQGIVFYASAGVVDNTTTGFSAQAIAAQSAKATGSVAAAARQFADKARSPFSISLTEIRRDHPDFYGREVRGKPEPLQTIFASMEKKIPVFALVYFTIKETPGQVDVDSHISDCPGTACRSGYAAQLLGEDRAASKLGAVPSFWDRGDIEAAHQMVAAEITDRPGRVGGPVDIVLLNANGWRWLNKKQECR